MPNFDDLVESGLSDMENAASDLIDGYTSAGKDVTDKIMKLLSNYSTKGKLDTTQAERNKIFALLDKVINDGFNEGKVPETIDLFIHRFQDVATNAQETQKVFNGLTVSDNLITAPIEFYAQQTRAFLSSAGIGNNLTQPIRQIIYANLIAGASLADTEKILRNFIQGNGETLGRMENIASQIARDTIYQLNGTIQSEIADRFGLDAVQFVGSIKVGVHKKLKSGGRSKTLTNDSRLQCKKMAAIGLIPIKDFPYWINFGYTQGTGMIPNTTPQNYVVVRNGFNCRHLMIPTKSK